jgi:hypothetical protein
VSGDLDILGVRNAPTREIAYGFFDLSLIPNNVRISKAILRIFVKDVTQAGMIEVTRAVAAWDEDTVTWNSRPDRVGAPIVQAISAADINSYIARGYSVN